MTKKYLGLFLISLTSAYLGAADLKPPFAMPSARVLPKGVRNLSFKTILAQANDRFNNSGAQVSVADQLFKNITYKDLIMGKRDPVDKAGIMQLMDKLNANENDKLAETIGQVNIKATAYVPVLAFGLSDKNTLAVAVPVIRYSTNVDTGVIISNPDQYNAFLNGLVNSKRALLKGTEFQNKMYAPINSKVSEYGYESLKNEEGTILGDIKVIGKRKVLESSSHLVSIQGEVTLPTGKKADVNKVINITGGDGQTDLGGGVIHDFTFFNYMTLSSQAIYTVQFQDNEKMRIPERQDSRLTPDIDNNTSRNLGDSFLGQVGLKWNYAGLNLGSSYALQYKEKDEYKGREFESVHYTWLSQDTRQRMQTVQFLAGFDTVDMYKKGQFKAPLSILLNYTLVTEGKNVVKDPVTSLDFNLFF